MPEREIEGEKCKGEEWLDSSFSKWLRGGASTVPSPDLTRLDEDLEARPQYFDLSHLLADIAQSFDQLQCASASCMVQVKARRDPLAALFGASWRPRNRVTF